MAFRSHRRRRRRRRRKRISSAPPTRPFHRAPEARRGGRTWRWLGLGALLVAAASLLRRERRPPPPAEPPPPADPPPPPADVDSSWIAGPAGTLHLLERHPDGRLPIVFVHGLGGRAEHWTAQLAAAGPAIRAVAFDLPGHGRSDQAVDGDYSIPATAAAIGAVVDGLGLRRTVLVAHSLGATAAIEYAGTRPERVAGLLLVDPSGDQSRLPDAHRRQHLAELARDPDEEIRWSFKQLLLGASAEVADRVLEDLASVPAEVVLSAIEGGVAFSPLTALERFHGPIRCLISDLNDLPYSLHNLRPDLPTFHFRGAGHWLMMDRPDDLWASLVDFLDTTVSE